MRPQHLIGSDVFDPDDRKVGRVGAVYLDAATREPAWVTVGTGLFGRRESLVPLDGARLSERKLRITVAKEVVKDAPTADGPLTEADAHAAQRFYGLPDSEPPVPYARVPKPSDMPRRPPQQRYVVHADQQVTKSP
ncbi:PRC-barrel domain-containing protein [Actinokineospora iranica]|nr:PRC-barrel domain-containing protein [Actinokineospora iranica]